MCQPASLVPSSLQELTFCYLSWHHGRAHVRVEPICQSPTTAEGMLYRDIWNIHRIHFRAVCACPAQCSPALEMNRDALPLPPKPLHFRPK
jgi:hypothetical protein